MIRKYLLPILALLGVGVIIIAIVLDNRPTPSTGPAIQWPEVPFSSYVSGAGILEARHGNIVIGTPAPGIVTAVFVKWGDRVSVGDPLFKIDDQDVQAQRVIANASVAETKAKLTQAKDQLRLAESVPDQRAISREEVANRRAVLAMSEAAWLSAKARAAQLTLSANRLTVRAMQPGKVLQINIHPGEFAQGGAQAKPLLLIGDVEQLSVRVDIDEFDASRVSPGAAAVAFVRGAPHNPLPLKFDRIEPYVGPKTALTGSPTERVDSRVLQVIYSFDAKALPLYVGQQMDVYIESAASPSQPKKLTQAPTKSLHQGAP
jgi:multidrug efflux pump subunit AcrA (membrane-fusion protein)